MVSTECDLSNPSIYPSGFFSEREITRILSILNPALREHIPRKDGFPGFFLQLLFNPEQILTFKIWLRHPFFLNHLLVLWSTLIAPFGGPSESPSLPQSRFTVPTHVYVFVLQ